MCPPSRVFRSPPIASGRPTSDTPASELQDMTTPRDEARPCQAEPLATCIVELECERRVLNNTNSNMTVPASGASDPFQQGPWPTASSRHSVHLVHLPPSGGSHLSSTSSDVMTAGTCGRRTQAVEFRHSVLGRSRFATTRAGLTTEQTSGVTDQTWAGP